MFLITFTCQQFRSYEVIKRYDTPLSLKMEESSKYSSVIRKFCEESTVHALKLINGFTAKVLSQRLFWLFMFFFLSSLTIWKCTISVQKYLQFDIRTTVTYTKRSEALIFPAITICNKNIFRRSVVSASEVAILLLSKIYTLKDKDFEYLYSVNRRFCKHRNETDILTEFEANPAEYLDKYGMEQVMNLIGINSRMSVLQCWWKDRATHCPSLIYNHLMDDGLCFTVNPSRGENTIYNSIFGTNQNGALDNKLLSTTSAGPKSGLRLLLNVTQDEYCGYFWKDNGAGFSAYIHGQTSGGFFSDGSALSLKPGTSYNIAVKPIEYLRMTESLGFCKSTVDLKNIDLQGDYLISACKLLCYVQFIQSKCNCYPLAVGHNVDTINRLFGLNSSICKVNQVRCFSRKTENFYTDYVKDMCPDCLPQCSETLYSQTVTTEVFPSNNMMDTFHKKLNESDTKTLKSNYIVLNIFFESMSLERVVESQDYGFNDMIVFIGSNNNLFLGTSMVSLFEPIYLALLCWYPSIFETLKKYLKPCTRLLNKFYRNKGGVQKIKKRNIKINKVHPFQIEPAYRRRRTNFPLSN